MLFETLKHADVSSGRRASEAEFAPRVQALQPSIQNVSFGTTADYLTSGGQRVISDHSPENAPFDLSITGLNLTAVDSLAPRATAAYVMGTKTIRIRLRLSSPDRWGTAYIQAAAGNNPRVLQTRVDFRDGVAQLDVPVVGISTDAVRTIEETWTWSCSSEAIAPTPIRIYITAGRAINRLPRESFYHVACAVSGAGDSVSAERDLWSHFTGFNRGKPVLNARGQRLSYWRSNKPGAQNTNFIDRDAAGLVTSTDSSCRGWAELFREALAIHGIESSVRAVRPKLSYVQPRLGLPMFVAPSRDGRQEVLRTIGILVKPFQWKPVDQISPLPFSREQVVINPGRFLWKIDNPLEENTYHWPQPDVQDLLRPGHTCLDDVGQVHGMFGNHAVVLIRRPAGETWYDPSFGFGPHPSLLSYENELLGRGEANPGGLFAIIGWKREVRADPVTGKAVEFNDGILLGAAPAPPGPMLEAVDPG